MRREDRLCFCWKRAAGICVGGVGGMRYWMQRGVYRIDCPAVTSRAETQSSPAGTSAKTLPWPSQAPWRIRLPARGVERIGVSFMRHERGRAILGETSFAKLCSKKAPGSCKMASIIHNRRRAQPSHGLHTLLTDPTLSATPFFAARLTPAKNLRSTLKPTLRSP